MRRAELVPGSDDQPEKLGFICPGCNGDWHFVPLNLWSLSGSLEAPTLNPSVVTTVEFAAKPSTRCHLFVTDGKIRYLSDCTHNLAGQAIEMPEIRF